VKRLEDQLGGKKNCPQQVLIDGGRGKRWKAFSSRGEKAGGAAAPLFMTPFCLFNREGRMSIIRGTIPLGVKLRGRLYIVFSR